MAGFKNENVMLAIEYSKDHCSQTHITYTELFAAAGLNSPRWYHENGGQTVISDFMEQFHAECIKLELPPFDSFVVNESGERAGYPGIGYFKINGLKDPFGDRTKAEDSKFAISFQINEREEIARWCSDR